MFRDLKTTSLVYVNLTACDLKNPLVEKIVLALRPLKTIQKLVVAENFELELMALDLMFKTKKIKVTVDEDN